MLDTSHQKNLHRLGKIRGQIDGISKMIENGKNTMDVITQILAVQGALKSVSLVLLENHLQNSGGEHLGISNRWKKDRLIKDIIKTCQLAGR